MQTTTFRCGHCNNLMAVSSEFLGRQVQCPTCRQVVLAPAAPAPSAPSPTPSLTPGLEPIVPQNPVSQPTPTPSSLELNGGLNPVSPQPEPLPQPTPPPQPTPMPSLSLDSEHESIFSEQAGDDLFDEPTPVLAPTPTPVYEPEPVPEPVMTPTPIEALPLTPEPAAYPEPIPVQADTPSTGWDVSQPATTITSEAPVAESELPSVGREARKKKGPQLNWPLLLMIPLVSYSILATALILYLWNRIEAVRTSVANPLEFMPDIHGDAPGATKKNVRRGWKPDENQALAALPNDHKARLGEKIVVGNLEVEPVRVERGKINIKVAGYNPEPTIADTLILRMRFRNLSEDFTFAPLDNAFDRKWKGIKMEGVPPLDYKPFTVLQVGSTNYFGGTAKWIPRNPPAALRRTHREWMLGEGRGETPVPLDPGQVLESFVATDGDDEKLVPTALAHNGDLVWRVHVRQGPVEVKGRNEPIPSTTVIAVTFKPSEVKPKEES